MGRRKGSRLPLGWTSPEGCLCPDTDTLSEKWKPRKRVSTIEWFRENLILPKRLTDSAGRFNDRNFPFQVGPLLAFDDLAVKIISLQWGTQLGKSTMSHGLIVKIADNDPSPMMFAGPDETFVKEISNDRIMPFVLGVPRVAERLLPLNRRDALKPDFGDCCLYMAWSGSPATLGNRACRYVFCSELSKWDRTKSEEADPADLVRERVKAFYDSKIFFEGTPTIEGICRIEALGRAANQRLKYFMPCKHCGAWINFIFKWLKFDKGPDGKPNRDIAENTARYECQKCGGVIYDSDKLLMMRRGIWAESGESIPKDFDGNIYYSPGKNKKRIHFELSSIYSTVLTFGDVASEFIRCSAGEGKKTLQNFINGWLAETWSPIVKKYSWQEIKNRLTVQVQSKIVPEWVHFLTAGIDPGKNITSYVIRGWGFGGRSRLISWGQIGHNNDLIAFNQIEAYVFNQVFPVVNSKNKMNVMLAGIDSGYLTQSVYEFVNDTNLKYGECCRAIKGQKIARAPYWVTALERSGADGKIIEGGIPLWNIGDPHWKGFLSGKYMLSIGQPGAWELPNDVDEQYCRSIVAEVLQEVREKNGHVHHEWIVVDQTVGNHYFDCEKIAAAMADMCGWRDIAEGGRPAKNNSVTHIESVRRNRDDDFISPVDGWLDG